MSTALPTARAPFFARLKVGHGGFVGWLTIESPKADWVPSLPALAHLARPAWVVSGLYVHPKRRGKGWAHQLVEIAQSFARVQAHDLYLWAQPFGGQPDRTKRQLQRFYRKHGFNRVGQDAAKDAWYFWAYDAV